VARAPPRGDVVEDLQLPQSQAVAPALTYELDEYAEDLAVIKCVAIGASVSQWSLDGASIVTLFLNRYPARVERAILTCSGIFEYDEKAFAAFHKFGGYVVKFRPKWLGKIPLLTECLWRDFASPIPAESAFLQDFLVADYEAALNTIFTSVSKAATELMPQEFAGLTVPLFGCREYDKIIPAEIMAAAMNDKVEFALISNTAHFPMLEDPATYLQSARILTDGQPKPSSRLSKLTPMKFSQRIRRWTK